MKLNNAISQKFKSIYDIRKNYKLLKSYLNKEILKPNFTHNIYYFKINDYIINHDVHLGIIDVYYIDIKRFIIDLILYQRLIELFNEFDGFYPYILNPDKIDFNISNSFQFKNLKLKYITFNIGNMSKYISKFQSLFVNCYNLKYINTNIKIINKNYDYLNLKSIYKNCNNLVYINLYYNFHTHIYYGNNDFVYIPILKASVL